MLFRSDIIALLTSLGETYGRIGIEAGPLSQWLVNALTAAELPVICVETRHMKALLTAQQINKTDRNDARSAGRSAERAASPKDSSKCRGTNPVLFMLARRSHSRRSAAMASTPSSHTRSMAGARSSWSAPHPDSTLCGPSI